MVGLGYLRLGQPANTLSGGESQRLKLTSFIRQGSSGQTLFLFDEPTTGLHFDDISKLLFALNRLVDGGASVVVIEHNLDVVKCADWVIDLGPGGGSDGGQVVDSGPPVVQFDGLDEGDALAGVVALVWTGLEPAAVHGPGPGEYGLDPGKRRSDPGEHDADPGDRDADPGDHGRTTDDLKGDGQARVSAGG